MAERTAKKLRQGVEQEWAPGCPDPQERCLLTDVLAAKLRVTDEAARKGRQRDPGLPDKVVHIERVDRWHGSKVQIQLRLVQAKLCLEQRPGLSQSIHQGSAT
jgi:hypothetical protein